MCGQQPDDKDMLRREELVAAGRARDDGRCGDMYPADFQKGGPAAVYVRPTRILRVWSCSLPLVLTDLTR